jgi:hypothetical protein
LGCYIAADTDIEHDEDQRQQEQLQHRADVFDQNKQIFAGDV